MRRLRLPVWGVRLGLLLLAVQTLLTIAHLAAVALAHGEIDTFPSEGMSSFVNLDSEANIPTWWSGILLASVGVTATGMWFFSVMSRGRAWHWLIVGVGFLLMSMDEVAVLHERIGGRVGNQIDAVKNSGVYIWPILFLPAMVVVAWALIRAARELGSPFTRAVATGIVAFGVAAIAEILSGGGAELRSTAETLIEENLELGGAGLLLVVFAVALSRRLADFHAAGEFRSGDLAPVDGMAASDRAEVRAG